MQDYVLADGQEVFIVTGSVTLLGKKWQMQNPGQSTSSQIFVAST
jgi:hypothetical protein